MSIYEHTSTAAAASGVSALPRSRARVHPGHIAQRPRNRGPVGVAVSIRHLKVSLSCPATRTVRTVRITGHLMTLTYRTNDVLNVSQLAAITSRVGWALIGRNSGLHWLTCNGTASGKPSLGYVTT